MQGEDVGPHPRCYSAFPRFSQVRACGLPAVVLRSVRGLLGDTVAAEAAAAAVLRLRPVRQEAADGLPPAAAAAVAPRGQHTEEIAQTATIFVGEQQRATIVVEEQERLIDLLLAQAATIVVEEQER